MTEALLEISGLKTYFRTDAGVVKAVDDLSLQLQPGRTLGLVGESGSGKSVTSLTILRLLPDVGAEIAGGKISFLGQDLIRLPRRELQKIRGRDISMIFQEPGTSLNPVYRVGDQVIEAMRLHQSLTYAAARQATIELFREVGIPEPEQRIDSYPHEMSGGQKQRVMIAMALCCNPKILIADEPTTALDVTIQKQILDLLRKLRDTRRMAMLFITHDLGVIAEIADDVAVMFRGKLVEQGPILDVFRSPRHPYTKGLLACRPQLASTRRRLPTVADYMDVVTQADGSLSITEKVLAPQRLQEIEGRGRGPLWHPVSELQRLGIAAPHSRDPGDVRTVLDTEAPLLEVDQLQVYYPIRRGLLRRTVGHIKAVDGVSFKVYRGQTLGLVGESGCGKTTTGRALLKLVPITGGRFRCFGMNFSELTGQALRRERRRLQIVFQDPYSSLNPRLTVEDMLTEAMAVHRLGTSNHDRRDRAAALLQEVGLLPEHLPRYPHEFSGGQRQRIGIARALAVEPELLICDESVSALDVSVQAQVLNLLKDLQEKRGLTYIFISHDLSVVKFMADMMAVMNQGKIVEYGPSDRIYANPQNDYTKRLIAAIPRLSLAELEASVRARAASLSSTAAGSTQPASSTR
jgi:peptide/nickel transport system ATP-binding protein